MIDTAFYNLVKEMRDAQKDYFKTRDISALRTARDLEKQVDDIIKQQYQPILNLE